MMDRMTGRTWQWFVVAMVVLGAAAAAMAQDRTAGRLAQIEVLDLATAARIALAENPSLAAAQARIEQAREIVQQARAAYWPRLDASASASRVDLARNSTQLQTQRLFPGLEIDNPQDYYGAGVAASWVLFDGFARQFRLAQARYGEQLSTAAWSEVQRLLLAAVTGAFLQAQQSLENINIAQADLEFNQRLLSEARLRHRVGTGTLSEVLNFQIRANSAQAQRIQAEQNYETARTSLAALLGLPEARLPVNVSLAALTPATPEELNPLDSQDLLETAFRLRPDLEIGDQVIRQAEADIRIAEAELYFPNVSLAATYEAERPDDPGFSADDFGNTVSLRLSYNLFAGGFYKARQRAARARLRETEKDLQSTRLDIASEVSRSVTQILSAQEQLHLQQDNTELVEQNRDLVEKEYKAGVGSLVRLNEAQRDLIAAQVQLAGARVSLRQAWYNLRAATGEIAHIFRP
jgi:outer membrane protein